MRRRRSVVAVAATMVAFFSIPAMPVEVKGLKIGYNGYGD
jgi:hypothetical protein